MATNVKALIDAIKTADTGGGGRCECDDDLDQFLARKKGDTTALLDDLDQFYGQGKRRHHRCHWEMSSLFNIHLVYLMAPNYSESKHLWCGRKLIVFAMYSTQVIG